MITVQRLMDAVKEGTVVPKKRGDKGGGLCPEVRGYLTTFERKDLKTSDGKAFTIQDGRLTDKPGDRGGIKVKLKNREELNCHDERVELAPGHSDAYGPVGLYLEKDEWTDKKTGATRSEVVISISATGIINRPDHEEAQPPAPDDDSQIEPGNREPEDDRSVQRGTNPAPWDAPSATPTPAAPAGPDKETMIIRQAALKAAAPIVAKYAPEGAKLTDMTMATIGVAQDFEAYVRGELVYVGEDSLLALPAPDDDRDNSLPEGQNE